MVRFNKWVTPWISSGLPSYLEPIPKIHLDISFYLHRYINNVDIPLSSNQNGLPTPETLKTEFKPNYDNTIDWPYL